MPEFDICIYMECQRLEPEFIELENGKNRAEVEIDNSMFGQEVLEELGITKEKANITGSGRTDCRYRCRDSSSGIHSVCS